MTNAELAAALRALAEFLDQDPKTAVDDQVRSAVADLVGEMSKRHARRLLDTNLSAIISWVGRFRKTPEAPSDGDEPPG